MPKNTIKATTILGDVLRKSDLFALGPYEFHYPNKNNFVLLFHTIRPSDLVFDGIISLLDLE